MSEWSDPQGTHVEGYVICISEAFLAVNGGETVVDPRRVAGKEGRKGRGRALEGTDTERWEGGCSVLSCGDNNGRGLVWLQCCNWVEGRKILDGVTGR